MAHTSPSRRIARLYPSVGFQNHWQVDLRRPRHWNGQISGGSYRCFHLLFPVVQIHMSNGIFWGVVIWIEFTLPVLNLEDSWYSLPTEGNLISSRAADDNPLVQVKLKSVYCLAHHLGQRDSGWMIPVNQFHYSIAVSVIAGHITVDDVLDGA